MEQTTVVFLADLTATLVAASVLGALARKVGVTPILGYVVAGIAIGPFTPGYHTTSGLLSGLSELGLILLLFSLGLGFSVADLRRISVVPMAGNVVLMSLFCLAAFGLGKLFGFQHPLTLGLTFTLSSTAIGVALLKIFGLLNRRQGHVAVALLVAQDLIAVLILVVSSTPAADLTPAGALIPLLKAGAFVAAALLVGGTILHRVVVTFLRRAPADALIAFCTSVALVAAWLGHAAGLSFELGAFVAGAVTSEAAGSRMVESVVAPFRELFIMIFFVSIGTFVDVGAVVTHWQAIVAIGLALAVARWLGWYGLSLLGGQPSGTAVAMGIAFLPLGEFHVVLANHSFAAHRLDSGEYATVIGATLVTVLLSTLATRVASPHLRTLDAAGSEAREPFTEDAELLILGYGRVGRTVGTLCKRAGIPFAVIETDVDLVRAAQADGAQARYGDGNDPRVVEQAIAPATRVVLSTVPDTAANAVLARRLSHFTGAHIVARAQRVGDIRTLRAAGVTTALVPEAEGAYGFAETVLAEFGVSDDRIAALVREHRANDR